MIELDQYIVKIGRFNGKGDFVPYGAGFFFSHSCVILTCYHVVNDIKNTTNTNDIYVSWNSYKQPVKVEIYQDFYDEKIDFAILKLHNDIHVPSEGILNIDEKWTANNDDIVYGKGFQNQRHCNPSPSNGYALGYETGADGYRRLILKNADSAGKGLSGSPALNEKDKVIGIFFGIEKDCDETSDGGQQYKPTKAIVIPIIEIVKKLDILGFYKKDEFSKKSIFIKIKKIDKISNRIFKSKTACYMIELSDDRGNIIYYEIDIVKIIDISKNIKESFEKYYFSAKSESALAKVKRDGCKLFELLFNNEWEDRFIEYEEKDMDISIYINIDFDSSPSDIIDIPWNCIYMKDAKQFWGKRYNISVHVEQSDQEYNYNFSSYAAHDSEYLKNVKKFIVESFGKTIYLKCGNDIYFEKNKNKTESCESIKIFCEKIKKYKPNILFLSFNNCQAKFNLRKKINIGKMEINIKELKALLCDMEECFPIVIITGQKINYESRIMIKKTFICELSWGGIFMDGNVPLNLASNFLCHFFNEVKRNNYVAISKALFEARKKYENDTGLLFTAYLNR